MGTVNYILTRSKRKTVAIHIRDGLVQVRAPVKTPIANIERFILSKEDWINEKLAQSKERVEKKESFVVDYGGRLLYKGEYFPLIAREGCHIGFDEEEKCFFVPPGYSAEQVRAHCIDIYKLLAKRDLSRRVEFFSEKMNLFPAAVKINSAKTRWGSCSSKRNVNFSWMLIMADEEVIDYIVVHEIAHIKQMNHSAEFWDVVSQFAPNFEDCRARLKKLQLKLNEEDWG